MYFENEFDSEIRSSYEEIIEEHLAGYNYSKVPSNEIIDLLNKHGFTTNKFKFLLEYIESSNYITFLGIVGKLIGTVDIKKLNIILDYKINTFKKMVDEIHLMNNEYDKSKSISFLIDMIYSFIPFKIIPLINFIIDINKLYLLHTKTNFVSSKVIDECVYKKRQFYSKYLGLDNPTHDSLVIMNKLFEYGIPYQRVKSYIQILEESLPDKFSIHDIKKIIFENESMNDLKIYFE